MRENLDPIYIFWISSDLDNIYNITPALKYIYFNVFSVGMVNVM